MIALVLSVYGAVGDASVEGIGWPIGLIVLAIALVTFALVDFVKVLTITVWNKQYTKSTVQNKKQTRAKRFQQEHSHSLQWHTSGH